MSPPNALALLVTYPARLLLAPRALTHTREPQAAVIHYLERSSSTPAAPHGDMGDIDPPTRV